MFKPSGTRQNAATTSHAIIDELIDKYPNIQISVPIHVEDLEDENLIKSKFSFTNSIKVIIPIQVYDYFNFHKILIQINLS